VISPVTVTGVGVEELVIGLMRATGRPGSGRTGFGAGTIGWVSSRVVVGSNALSGGDPEGAATPGNRGSDGARGTVGASGWLDR